MEYLKGKTYEVNYITKEGKESSTEFTPSKNMNIANVITQLKEEKEDFLKLKEVKEIKNESVENENDFYTDEAKKIYEIIQEELTDEQRIEIAKKELDIEMTPTIEDFWDWLELLDSDEIEELADKYSNIIKIEESVETSTFKNLDELLKAINDGVDLGDDTYDVINFIDYEHEETAQEDYDKFLETMSKELKVIKYDPEQSYVLTSLTEYAKNHIDLFKNIFVINEDEEEDVLEEIVVNIIPSLINGYTSNSTYKDLVDGLKTLKKENKENRTNKLLINCIEWISDHINKDDIKNMLNDLGITQVEYEQIETIKNKKLVLQKAINWIMEHISKENTEDVFKKDIELNDKELKEYDLVESDSYIKDLQKILNKVEESLTKEPENKKLLNKKAFISKKVNDLKEEALSTKTEGLDYISNKNLPDFCYTYVETEGVIGIIKKGVEGYYPTKIDLEKYEIGSERSKAAREIVDQMNKDLEVTPDMQLTMELRSMFGWDVGDKEESDLKENNNLNEEKLNDKEHTELYNRITNAQDKDTIAKIINSIKDLDLRRDLVEKYEEKLNDKETTLEDIQNEILTDTVIEKNLSFPEYKEGDIVDIYSTIDHVWLPSNEEGIYVIIRKLEKQEIQGLYNTDLPCYEVEYKIADEKSNKRLFEGTQKVCAVNLRKSLYSKNIKTESINEEEQNNFLVDLDNCETVEDIQDLIHSISDGVLENTVQEIFDSCMQDEDDLDTIKSLIDEVYQDNAEIEDLEEEQDYTEIFDNIDNQLNDDLLLVLGNYDSNYPDFKSSGEGGKVFIGIDAFKEYLANFDEIDFYKENDKVMIEASDHDGTIAGALYTVPEENKRVDLLKALGYEERVSEEYETEDIEKIGVEGLMEELFDNDNKYGGGLLPQEFSKNISLLVPLKLNNLITEDYHQDEIKKVINKKDDSYKIKIRNTTKNKETNWLDVDINTIKLLLNIKAIKTESVNITFDDYKNAILAEIDYDMTKEEVLNNIDEIALCIAENIIGEEQPEITMMDSPTFYRSVLKTMTENIKTVIEENIDEIIKIVSEQSAELDKILAAYKQDKAENK